jgi:hypothetical protein
VHTFRNRIENFEDDIIGAQISVRGGRA